MSNVGVKWKYYWTTVAETHLDDDNIDNLQLFQFHAAFNQPDRCHYSVQ